MSHSIVKKRKLSIPRLLLSLAIIIGVGFGIDYWLNQEALNNNFTGISPWFASYVDVTATPRYDFEQLGANQHTKNVVLSFIVSASDNPCLPTWGNAYTLTKAGEVLDLDRRIARLRQQGGDIAISFGGLLNDELAVNCKDTEALYTAYSDVIDKYKVHTLDFDLEGKALLDTESISRRSEVLARLQSTRRSGSSNLAIWITLPVTPQGLTEAATNAIAEMLRAGVDITGINIMTMNYGESKNKNSTMESASKEALFETHRQLGILYEQAGFPLTSKSLWKKLGATPMIGQNDIKNEVFNIDDAKSLNSFAHAQGISRLSMWSANRDIQCGDNYIDLTTVSDSCSGIKQAKLEYATTLSEGFSGSLEANSEAVTTKEEPTPIVTDNPENSPYPIWKEDGTYISGTKIVWRGNVYQAKWWTQGDIPDNPVLQSWQTPWQIIGPVLPGEKPIKQITLPKGILPEWSGTKQYNAGAKVMFEGVPYQAKWWTQGDSPAISSLNPTTSPWVPLNQKQIDELLGNK